MGRGPLRRAASLYLYVQRIVQRMYKWNGSWGGHDGLLGSLEWGNALDG